MWPRYCYNVSAILFILDSADLEAIPQANEELHALLSNGGLKGIPVLVLANKNDLPGALGAKEIIERM
jgi:ADP-ribosylation factor-like protein 8